MTVSELDSYSERGSKDVKDMEAGGKKDKAEAPGRVKSRDGLPQNDIDEDALLTPREFHVHTWKLLKDYFRQPGTIVKHQLDSYDDFVMCKIDQIIDGFNPIEILHDYMPDKEQFRNRLLVTMENPILSKPTICEKDGTVKTMMPNDARLRNMTYASTLTVQVNVKGMMYDEETGKVTEHTKRLTGVGLGKVPIMVRSRYCTLSQSAAESAGAGVGKDECPYDQGGYFIVNGTEKVVISQDRIAENKTYVFTVNKTSMYSHVSEIRSVAENKFGVPKTTALKLTAKATQFGRQIRTNILHIKTDLPLFVLFRALGLESDRDIVRAILGDDLDAEVPRILLRELVGSAEEGAFVQTSAGALEYMSKYLHAHGQPREMSSNASFRVSIVRSVLEREFLPHVGPDFVDKALYLGYMVNKLLRCYLGLWDMDDRDSYINKRIDTPGVCLANLFRQYFGKVVKDMKIAVQKEIRGGSWRASGSIISVINKTNIAKVVKASVIESGLKYGLATGNWGMKSARMRQGVAQVLNRMTDMSTLSHLRRVNTPIEKTGKLVQPRKLHATQWGVICPSETPEGASIGLVKNLAINCTVTVASSSDLAREKLRTEMGVEPLRERFMNGTYCPKATKVFVNGDIVGLHSDPKHLHDCLKRMKRMGVVHPHTSITWNIARNELCISTEGGRCVRPLYIVEDGAPRLRRSIAAETMRRLARGEQVWTSLVIGSSGRPIQATPPHLSVQSAMIHPDDFCGGVQTRRTMQKKEEEKGEEQVQEIHREEMDESLIEYLDIDETNSSMLAMRYEDLFRENQRQERDQEQEQEREKAPHVALRGSHPVQLYSHLEMDSSLMLGAMAGCIPFSDHNQAPRNTYQSAMGKQAVGVYATNFRHRFDTMAFVLNYPQRPLVSTQIASLVNRNQALSGINAVVAICTYTGFNQEDAVILNESAVQRGLFAATYYRTFREQNNKNHSSGEEEFFCRPDTLGNANGSERGAWSRGLNLHNYDKLATDGFVPENRFVKAGDVVVGKCMPQKVGSVVHHKDTSLALKNNEKGFIDRNAYGNHYFINTNGEGYTFAKTRLRTERIPTIGDKFSSRHGQKGTMGMMYPQQDMPYTADGLVPDVIINPNAIPSRMTIGQLMECIMGKACCGTGAFGDASPFTGITIDDIARQLTACGMEERGNEIMYNSRTGEQIQTAVFIGPTYYQRLKHMVDDKLHSRSNNGPVVMLTRQPAEGRARDGGLRLGEMELECNWAHGIMHFLKERFMECSDNFRVFTCKKCGLMAVVNPDRNIHCCRACRNSTHFAEIRIPYACKLLFQEIQAMGIGTKLLT